MTNALTLSRKKERNRDVNIRAFKEGSLSTFEGRGLLNQGSTSFSLGVWKAPPDTLLSSIKTT